MTTSRKAGSDYPSDEAATIQDEFEKAHSATGVVEFLVLAVLFFGILIYKANEADVTRSSKPVTIVQPSNPK